MRTVAYIVSKVGSLILIFLPQRSRTPTHRDTHFFSSMPQVFFS